jgi:hypothetical protein
MLLTSLLRRLRRRYQAALADSRHSDVLPVLRDYPMASRSPGR